MLFRLAWVDQILRTIGQRSAQTATAPRRVLTCSASRKLNGNGGFTKPDGLALRSLPPNRLEAAEPLIAAIERE